MVAGCYRDGNPWNPKKSLRLRNTGLVSSWVSLNSEEKSASWVEQQDSEKH